MRMLFTRVVPMCLWVFASLCDLTLAESRPNIVILMADDLGIGDVGCYGNTTLNTPYIDSLARDGVKMTQHMATASMCTPSRAAFLTGRYQIRSGMAEMEPFRVSFWAASSVGLPSEEVTIAELAKQAGYKTAIMGKWHLGEHASYWSRDYKHHPLNQGYDSWYGYPISNFKDFGDEDETTAYSANPKVYQRFATVSLVVILPLVWLYRRNTIGRFAFSALLFVGLMPILYSYFAIFHIKLLSSMLVRDKEVVEQPIRLKGLTGRMANEGIEFLEARAVDKEKAPFLLQMSWVFPHTYQDPSRRFKGTTRHGRYGDSVEEMDWGSGEILNAIERLGFSDNTLVYFTSDHGGHLEERGLHGEIDGGYNGIYKGGKSHGTVDGGIRVPGIIKWPGKIKPGTIVDETTSLMDIFPLIGKATGTPLPKDRVIDGKDIMPLIQGEETVSPHEFMFHYCTDEIHAVRYRPKTGKTTWKLAYKMPDYLPNATQCAYACSCKRALVLNPPVLFDMTSDPGENHPISIESDKKYKDIAAKIEDAVNAHKASIKPVEPQFTWPKVLWLPHLQQCCNFPHCQCTDPKYPDPEEHS